MPTPRLSVCFITYNHERYVEQALRSAIDQETDFEYEIVVGEDCSTDSTLTIVERIASERPELVRVLQRRRNLGPFDNLLDVAANCRGEYRATLEGDDFWTDRRKLQKQVDYLDRHTESVLCFTDANEIFELDPGRRSVIRPSRKDVSYSVRDILIFNFIPTCTVVLRNNIRIDYPQWFTKLGQCDLSQYVLMSRYGNYGYIPEVTATRRIHQTGLWSSLSKEAELKSGLSSLARFSDVVDFEHKQLIKKLMDAKRLDLAVEYENSDRHEDSVSAFGEIWPGILFNKFAQLRQVLRLFVTYASPVLRRYMIGRHHRTAVRFE